MNVFVVVLEDRHVDDEITVHRTRAAANARVAAIKKSYNRYAWTDRPYGQPDWIYYSEAHPDDGPTVRIEITELSD